MNRPSFFALLALSAISPARFTRGATGNASSFPQKRLVAAEAGAYSGFGAAIAVSGDTVVIGARYLNAEFPRSGAAFVFEREGEDWVESAKLLPSHPREGLDFGASVAIDGDTIVVGAPAGFLSPSAEVYVFDRDKGGGWRESDRIVWNNAWWFTFLPFGTHVALSGSTLAVAGEFPAGTTVNLYGRVPGEQNWELIRGVRIVYGPCPSGRSTPSSPSTSRLRGSRALAASES